MTQKVEFDGDRKIIAAMMDAAVEAGRKAKAQPVDVVTAGAYLSASALLADGFLDADIETDDYNISIRVTKKTGTMQA